MEPALLGAADVTEALNALLESSVMTFQLHTWYSSRPPASLAIAAVYFGLGGVLLIVGTAIQVVIIIGGGATPEEVAVRPVYTAAYGMSLGALWLAAGILLWNHKKVGAWLAVASLALKLAEWLASGLPTLTEALFFIAVLALIAISWRSLETSEGGQPPYDERR